MITLDKYTKAPLHLVDAVVVDGNAKPVLPLYRPPEDGQFCRIDWISFTMNKSSISVTNDTDALSEKYVLRDAHQNAVVSKLAQHIEQMFGFGIERKLDNPQNFYEHTYALEYNTGTINIGGQNDTILVSINGTGCTYAQPNCFEKLQAFLNYCHKVKITRIDICFDDLDGQLISPDWANDMDDIGGFTNRGRKPKFETAGNWKRPDGKGRTAYIGSRQSSKFLRIYEKGMQLGDSKSAWTRAEVVFKGKAYHIPLDILTNPSGAFIASYPCFKQLFENRQISPMKFDLIKRSQCITVDKLIEITKHQHGRNLNALRDLCETDEQLLNLLTDVKNKAYPERLIPLTIPTTH